MTNGCKNANKNSNKNKQEQKCNKTIRTKANKSVMRMKRGEKEREK